MLKINVSLLISTLNETKAFSLPEMNAGTRYLFDMVYKKLLDGETIRLSELDHDRFKLEDVTTLKDIYDNIILKNNYKSQQVIGSMENAEPVRVIVSFA